MNNIILLLIFFIIIYIVYYWIEKNEYYKISINSRSLEKDGFCVFYNPYYSLVSQDYPSRELENDILNILPNGYIFIDYIYKIKNTSLSTFHRDVTSSKNIYKTKYPVYTLILYNYDGCLLSVCPGSHKTYPFVLSNIVNINGKKGTAFLFDSDLLHCGCFNDYVKRNLIQYKICHQEDLSNLSHLNGIKMEKKSEPNNYFINPLTRKISYFLEMPINYWFYPLLIKKEENNTLLGKIQSIIPLNFYNNN